MLVVLVVLVLVVLVSCNSQHRQQQRSAVGEGSLLCPLHPPIPSDPWRLLERPSQRPDAQHRRWQQQQQREKREGRRASWAARGGAGKGGKGKGRGGEGKELGASGSIPSRSLLPFSVSHSLDRQSIDTMLHTILVVS